MITLILTILLLLILCYLILYKNLINILENYIFENIFFVQIFIEHGFLFLLLSFLIWFFLDSFSILGKFFLLVPYFFFINSYKRKDDKLTDWEIEFLKEKEEQEKNDEIEKIKEEKAFKKNRSERRKRRKIRYETVEYPGEKYHPDYDGVYFFYERFQDAIWRTKNVKIFRSKFKIYFPLFLLFVFVFIAWLIDCLSGIDYFIFNTNSFYVKIDNQFVCLNKKSFAKKGIRFLTVIDWDNQSVNRYKILRNGKFKKYQNFFITSLDYNWMFQKDVRSKKFPFKFYNWIFYKNNIMICGEKCAKYKTIYINSTIFDEHNFFRFPILFEASNCYNYKQKYHYHWDDTRPILRIKIMEDKYKNKLKKVFEYRFKKKIS